MTENLVQRKITKIMSKETAVENLNSMLEKIGGVNIDNICEDRLQITIDDYGKEPTLTRLIQGVMCGLVYWDENNNCMVQELIHPIKSGELTADKLYYKYKLKVFQMQNTDLNSPIGIAIKLLSDITGRPAKLISQMSGLDIDIAVGCLNFFGQ